MAVEIVFLNVMSIDPETAVLTSWFNKRNLPKPSNWRQRENAILEQKLIFRFWFNITTEDHFISRCIDLHGLIIHHKKCNVQ